MKNSNWRIRKESDTNYIVEKKYFEKYWYSFDWKSFFETYIGMNFAIIFITFIISCVIKLSTDLIFFEIFKIIGLILCLLEHTLCILFNRISFETYNKAESFIKERLKEDID